jgi:hypothetical protein
MMNEQGAANQFTRREEKKLLELASEYVRSGFPNPERLGCPGSEALKSIAGRHLKFPEAEDIVDHIATCSPCFVEYKANRRRSRRRLVGGTALCCVLGLLLSGLIWRFATLARPQNETIAQRPPTALKAVLDFRNRTTERSDRKQPPNEAFAPHLRRAQLDLIIDLPVGVEDGLYSVQFRNQAGQSVVNAAGTAAWNGAAETLAVAVDLRNLPPGDYVLAIRSGTSSWREYVVILDQ